MNKLEALTKLRDKVKAGESLPTYGRADPCQMGQARQHIGKAFDGSLDAAKALHEAVLPGWGWECGVNATFVSLAVVWKSGRDKAFCQSAEVPSRAWLLAILEALIAQEASHD
jgi:hypothetical protein